MSDPKDATKKLTIYVTEAEHRALRLESVQRGRTMSQIVREALHSRIMLVSRPVIEVKGKDE
jgi:hypothetical protein